MESQHLYMLFWGVQAVYLVSIDMFIPRLFSIPCIIMFMGWAILG